MATINFLEMVIAKPDGVKGRANVEAPRGLRVKGTPAPPPPALLSNSNSMDHQHHPIKISRRRRILCQTPSLDSMGGKFCGKGGKYCSVSIGYEDT